MLGKEITIYQNISPEHVESTMIYRGQMYVIVEPGFSHIFSCK
jgi:hypothetical protein